MKLTIIIFLLANVCLMAEETQDFVVTGSICINGTTYLTGPTYNYDYDTWFKETESKKTDVELAERWTYREKDHIVSELILYNYTNHAIVYTGCLGLYEGHIPSIFSVDGKLLLGDKEYLLPSRTQYAQYADYKIKMILPPKSNASICLVIPIDLLKTHNARLFSIAIPYYDSYDAKTEKWVQPYYNAYHKKTGKSMRTTKRIDFDNLLEYSLEKHDYLPNPKAAETVDPNPAVVED